MTPDVNARQNASLRFARSFAVVCTVIVAVTILLAELVLPASSLFANQPVRLIWAAPAVGGLLLPAAFSLTAGVHAHAQKRPPLLARRDTRIVVGYSIGMVLFGAGPYWLSLAGWPSSFALLVALGASGLLLSIGSCVVPQLMDLVRCHRSSGARCANCGYSVDACRSPECPECGWSHSPRG